MTVENGGPLSSNKSINIPDVHILLPSLTDKDREDLKFAVDNDFDFIAASFVRKASDVEDIRAELRKHGGDNIRIIAKIENREGVENLDEHHRAPPTASWWPGAIWAWRSPPTRCPSSRRR